MNLFLLSIIVILVEIYLFAQMGELIGGFQTLLLVILTGTLGIYTLRNPKLVSIHKTLEQMKMAQTSTVTFKELLLVTKPFIERSVVFFGGILLIIPGFLTDVIGLVMFFSFSRMFLVNWLNQRIFIQSVMKGNNEVIEGKYRRED